MQGVFARPLRSERAPLPVCQRQPAEPAGQGGRSDRTPLPVCQRQPAEPAGQGGRSDPRLAAPLVDWGHVALAPDTVHTDPGDPMAPFIVYTPLPSFKIGADTFFITQDPRVPTVQLATGDHWIVPYVQIWADAPWGAPFLNQPHQTHAGTGNLPALVSGLQQAQDDLDNLRMLHGQAAADRVYWQGQITAAGVAGADAAIQAELRRITAIDLQYDPGTGVPDKPAFDVELAAAKQCVALRGDIVEGYLQSSVREAFLARLIGQKEHTLDATKRAHDAARGTVANAHMYVWEDGSEGAELRPYDGTAPPEADPPTIPPLQLSIKWDPGRDRAIPYIHYLPGSERGVYEISERWLRDNVEQAERADYDFAVRVQGLTGGTLASVWAPRDSHPGAEDEPAMTSAFVNNMVQHFYDRFVTNEADQEYSPESVAREAIHMHKLFADEWTRQHKNTLTPSVESTADAYVNLFYAPRGDYPRTVSQVCRLLRRTPACAITFAHCLSLFMAKCENERSGRGGTYKQMNTVFAQNVSALGAMRNVMRAQAAAIDPGPDPDALDPAPPARVGVLGHFQPLTMDWFSIADQLPARRGRFAGYTHTENPDQAPHRQSKWQKVINDMHPPPPGGSSRQAAQQARARAAVHARGDGGGGGGA